MNKLLEDRTRAVVKMVSDTAREYLESKDRNSITGVSISEVIADNREEKDCQIVINFTVSPKEIQ